MVTPGATMDWLDRYHEDAWFTLWLVVLLVALVIELWDEWREWMLDHQPESDGTGTP